MEIAIVGLGKMGKRLATRAMIKGIKVIGLGHGPIPDDLRSLGMGVAEGIEDLLKMVPPRKIFLYVPAGPVVEEYIQRLSRQLEEGDIVIDGGNSYWGDSIRRYHLLRESKIRFIDLGTSGGISGAREGACFMAGGEREAFDVIVPILEKLAAPDAFAYVGPPGSGHLVKLVHNGIEFGMLQAIGDGMALLEKFKEGLEFDMNAVLRMYQNGSVIRSWLIELMALQYEEQGGFDNVPPYIEDTGEVNWLINDAIHLEVPIPVIAQSVMELFRSRDDERIDHKAVAMMRHGFGGHPFGPKAELKRERLSGRIGNEFFEKSSEH